MRGVDRFKDAFADLSILIGGFGVHLKNEKSISRLVYSLPSN